MKELYARLKFLEKEIQRYLNNWHNVDALALAKHFLIKTQEFMEYIIEKEQL